MKIANEFTVSVPIEQAWDVLTDLEQVIPLMPGAQLTGREVDTDLKVVGKIAQFGSGMLQQVSEKLLGQFVESLEAKLAADSAAPVSAHNGAESAVTPRQPEAQPIDLLDLVSGSALKKYGPVVSGAFLLAAIVFALGRLRIARHRR